MAQAQKPEKAGEGVPTGQGSVQLFNYGGWLNNAGGQGTAPPVEATSVTAACLTDQDPGSADTRTTAACRSERLEALFKFLARKGVTNVELFGHSNFPASTDIAGLTAYRALLDKYGLHAGGWHGSMSETGWDARVNAARILGADNLGSGGFPSPGIGSYDDTLRTVEALNRLGKRSVEGGVGQVYFHNHQGEFRNRYVDNGVLKTAWQIVMERMDTRYSHAEIDAGWSSDAYDDPSGTITAGLINQFPNSVKQLHIKDMVRTIPTTGPLPDPLACNPCQNSQPVAFGTGEIDYRPIFNAAKGRTKYYHQEQDGGTLTDADISLTNLKGVGSQVVGNAAVNTTTLPSVPAGTASANNAVPVVIQNNGDAPLTISNVALATGGNARADESPGDFQVLDNTGCVGTANALAAAVAPTAENPGGVRDSCTVLVGFRPNTTNKTSVARLIVTSNGARQSGATVAESVYVVGRSTGDAVGTIGGTVDSVLQLTLGSAASFGSFVPAVGRNYDTAMAASIVSTAGDATLSVIDADTVAPGRLVNGTFALPSPLQIRAANAANPAPAFQPLSTTAGTPVTLLTYSGPTAGADAVTLGFRQAIGATDVLRAGSYSKVLTFTLSTTTP